MTVQSHSSFIDSSCLIIACNCNYLICWSFFPLGAPLQNQVLPKKSPLVTDQDHHRHQKSVQFSTLATISLSLSLKCLFVCLALDVSRGDEKLPSEEVKLSLFAILTLVSHLFPTSGD